MLEIPWQRQNVALENNCVQFKVHWHYDSLGKLHGQNDLVQLTFKLGPLCYRRNSQCENEGLNITTATTISTTTAAATATTTIAITIYFCYYY